ncbi:MAG TPA: hypothetical protein VGG69_08155 [Rhizomicrobium sp.]
MDPSVIAALAALLGAVIGGLTSVLAAWLTQRTQTRAHWLEQDVVRRQDLYKEFIEEASSCFVHALQNEEPDIPALVRLFAKIDRMRVLSSANVVDIAERIAGRVIDTYLEPAKSFRELHDMAAHDSIRPIREFSEACRVEFESLRTFRSRVQK